MTCVCGHAEETHVSDGCQANRPYPSMVEGVTDPRCPCNGFWPDSDEGDR